jgi:hypothetical protein
MTMTTKAEGDVRQVIERLAKTTCGDCLSTPCPHCAYLSRFGMTVADALTTQPAPSGWQQRIAAIVAEARPLVAELESRAEACYEDAMETSQTGEKADEQQAMKRYHFYARCENVFGRLVDALPPAPQPETEA